MSSVSGSRVGQQDGRTKLREAGFKGLLLGLPRALDCCCSACC